MTMGFYVPTNRDVKFPKACEQCHFYDGLLCCVMDTYVHDPENKHEECPLIEIPDNHGRLIDADALTDAIDSIDWYHQAPNKEMVHGANPAEHQAWYKEQDIFAAVENAPTIIEADKVV